MIQFLFSKFKTVLKNHWLQFSILTVMIFIVFYPYIFGLKPFIVGTDQQLTYNIYYTEWIRLVKNFLRTGELPFYSWYKFLGSDFYASSSIYVTGDFLLPILLIIKDIELGLFIETILLVYISSFSFHIFLNYFGIKKKEVRIFISILYAFSGIASLYFGSYMFHRFYALLPLLFAGLEHTINKSKPSLFILSTALLFISSFYFLFPTTLFLFVYYFFTIYRRDHKLTIKHIINQGFKFIFYYFTGFLISAVISLPAILYIIQNPRIGVTYDSSWFWSLKVLMGFFFSHTAAPYPIYTDVPYMFYSGMTGHESWYSVFTTSIAPVFLMNYFFFIKDKKKRIWILFYGFAIVSLLFKPLNSILHGFSESTFRFIFLYVLTTLLLFSYILDNHLNVSIKKGFITYTVLYGLAFAILYFSGILDIENYLNHILFLIASFILALFILGASFKAVKMRYLFVLIEIVFIQSFLLNQFSQNFYEYTPSINAEFIQYYQTQDDDIMYRMYIDPIHLYPTSSMNLNQSMNLKYYSVMSYDSAYEPNLRRFLQLNGINWHIINLNNPDVLRMLGVKYYAVYDEQELPENYSFTYMYDLNFLKVYKLNEYRSIGFTYSIFEPMDNIIDNVWVDWNNRALIENKDWPLIEDIQISETKNLHVISKSTNTLEGEIELTHKQLLFLSIPYNEGWSIRVDGEVKEFIKVNGGFIGIPLESGYHHIEMNYTTPGFYIGIFLSSIGTLLFFIIYSKKSTD